MLHAKYLLCLCITFKMNKFVHIPAILMVVSVLSSFAENNGTKPVIFLSSPPTSATNTSDNGNSESRVNRRISSDGRIDGQSSAGQKQVVSSQGYQLEVIDDNTEEAQERSGSENLRPQLGGLYSQAIVDQTASLLDQFLNSPSPDYDENSAKEDVKDGFIIPKGKLAYGDIQPKSDITKVRDIFVGKEVGGGKSYLPNPHSTASYPSSAPQESKYKLEYESPVKYLNTPIVLKQSTLPLVEPSPVHLSHPQGLLDVEVTGHTAGYGHGFHHHQQKLKAKPLKPSVVYRDPSDRFDHHDKIRTLDKDHLGSNEKDLRHPFGPHVIGKGHDYHDYNHGKKVIFEPTYYDQTKIPECAHKNKYIYNITFCLDDPHYPTETIVWALKESDHYAKKLLSDVTYQSADNLVTGLTRAEEEGYTYKHYFGASHAQNVHLDKYKPPYQGYTYSTDYFKKGGYICPSDIYYARPKRAMNTFGKWKVIVNVDHLHEHKHEKYGHGPIHGHHGGEQYGKGPGHEYGHYKKEHHGHDNGHYGQEGEHGHHDQGSYGKEHHGHNDEHYGKVHGQNDGHYGKDNGHGHVLHQQHGHDLHQQHGHGLQQQHGHDLQQQHGHDLQQQHGHGLQQQHGHHLQQQHGHGGGPHGLHGYGVDTFAQGHHSIKKREYKDVKKSYTQTLRLEQCIYPNAPCSYVDSHFHSRCIQKHNFVRLVAWTKEEGIHVDTFKMPIACSCHVRQPIHFYHESGHHEHKQGHIVPPVNSYHGHSHHIEPHGGLKKVY